MAKERTQIPNSFSI